MVSDNKIIIAGFDDLDRPAGNSLVVMLRKILDFPLTEDKINTLFFSRNDSNFFLTTDECIENCIASQDRLLFFL